MIKKKLQKKITKMKTKIMKKENLKVQDQESIEDFILIVFIQMKMIKIKSKIKIKMKKIIIITKKIIMKKMKIIVIEKIEVGLLIINQHKNRKKIKDYLEDKNLIKIMMIKIK